ncbi:MAG: type I restriction enzyme HsdR N-terminal domain-containing protein [Bacteroidota bacterium]
MNIDLNLLQFESSLQWRDQGGERFLFDPIRRQILVKTPEEIVRQLFLCHLKSICQYPQTYIAVEKELTINRRKKRFDILVYNSDYQPFILVECKAPYIKLSNDTFRQAAQYNLNLKVDYLVITNGRHTYCCAMNYDTQSYQFLPQLPSYQRS